VDLIPEEQREQYIADFIAACGAYREGENCFRISAISGQGCRELTMKLQTMLNTLSPVETPPMSTAAEPAMSESADDFFAERIAE
ncbi:MAG TPA: hypothetical protein PLX65_08595, partial [Accumulibacter sp.]|nr:hypothetical protein [Accumulibacter sp.]